ncbi:zinc-binding dehydrogenase [Caldinitratiruptor microaerophilus]|uniref:Alcohol dehydrogenase n=1 Tax=Caldinitratiruptor microaerophilus TaxID=671077 RepID=A0AA35G5K8_9FIRM|nr:zinc-binding dehydrogenase [Caldinitratiruptor microaerophilus]BDG59596.1 alcohol dehydrogenase [Caldinitratiruptor microaerophilus]
MKAVVLAQPGTADSLVLTERPDPSPGPGEAVVRLHAAALNHRDLFLRSGATSQGFPPFVMGSDGAGVVEAVGPGVTSVRPGDPVVINPTLSCGTCPACLAGEHSLCDRFQILGGPSDGTLAEFVRVPAQNLYPKPQHLDFRQAAALPLALATAWRAVVSRGRLQPGETVLIHGIGGGVALYALQIAVAMGARAIVTSSSDDKLRRALEMGASAAIHYRREDVAARVKELTDGRGADLVVDSGGRLTLPISVEAVRRGGRIAYFGATTGAEGTLNFRALFWKQVALLGTTMSNQSEFAAALRFVGHVRLVPQVARVFPLAEAAQAFTLLERGEQFGKVVLAVAPA